MRHPINSAFVVNNSVRSLGTVNGLIYPICAAILACIVSQVRACTNNETRKRSRDVVLFPSRYGIDTFFHVQGRTDGNHYLEARAQRTVIVVFDAAKTFPHCCRVYRCSISVMWNACVDNWKIDARCNRDT